MKQVRVDSPASMNFDSRQLERESPQLIGNDVVPDAAAFLAFLNHQPQSDEAAKAIEEMRRALLPLFPEADRISIITDISSDLTSEAANSPRLMMVEDALRCPGQHNGVSVTESPEVVDDMVATVLKTFRKHGHPLDKYHAPITLSVFGLNGAWLGTIFLWCFRNRPAPTQSTIDLLLAMAPYFRHALAGIIARHGAAFTERHAFREALEQLSRDCGLTAQEQRVLTYQLLGFSYKEIAAELDVAENTIKKHLNAVHRKADASGFVELIAKYFSFLVVRDPKNRT